VNGYRRILDPKVSLPLPLLSLSLPPGRALLAASPLPRARTLPGALAPGRTVPGTLAPGRALLGVLAPSSAHPRRAPFAGRVPLAARPRPRAPGVRAVPFPRARCLKFSLVNFNLV
jgi:hypothetical protein